MNILGYDVLQKRELKNEFVRSVFLFHSGSNMAIITLLLSCAILLYKHLSGDATIIFHSYFFQICKV